MKGVRTIASSIALQPSIPAVLTGRLTRCLAVLAVAAAAVLVGALPAQAAPGVNMVEATCTPNQIIVTAPTMQSSYSIYPNPDGILLVHGVQWVAFRTHLARYDGARWVYENSGPWFAKAVNNSGAVWEGDHWFVYENGAWREAQGSTYFTPRPGAYYKVYAEYYWYAMPHVNIGSDYLPPTWAKNHFDQRTGGPFTAGWVPHCLY